MKKTTLLAIAALAAFTGHAQTDSTKTNNDTMRIGNILIIKKGKKSNSSDSTIVLGRTNYSRKSNSRFTTNWGVIDLGFSNYSDKTNYANAGSYLVDNPSSPPLGAANFKLRAGSSINVNLWFFMQTMHLVKKNVNLKYGLGLELNNYRYKSALSYREEGLIPYSGGQQTNNPFIFRDSISFKKNKLATDYLTVPFMLNFASNKYNRNKGLSASFGVSAGYLYSQRNKQKSDERGKDKNKGEYDMERFKLSYIGELGIGPVKLYGSYSPKSMYEHSLDIRPFNVGFRISN
ncbi:MAG: outer membrane beta-barrel protein [Ferruginibacter sp.]